MYSNIIDPSHLVCLCHGVGIFPNAWHASHQEMEVFLELSGVP